ncbi:MAG: hypothetical protein CMM05_09130 [Rhodopirellula sp.]|nr:hypothetical protein [Rhodopirellula sp.]
MTCISGDVCLPKGERAKPKLSYRHYSVEPAPVVLPHAGSVIQSIVNAMIFSASRHRAVVASRFKASGRVCVG